MTPPAAKIHLPLGFTFSAITAGIKASGRPDLALVEAAPGTSAAALFTTNRVVAAPVAVGREFLARSRGRVRAVIVNSGNANCATGAAGLLACKQICRATARELKIKQGQVFPSSTGIIGVPLPAEKIIRKLPELIAARAATEGAARQFAEAIMTTDTGAKLASISFRSKKARVNLLGIAKGSGMIHPQMATMLVYICTDIAAEQEQLHALLEAVCDQTFNCMSVDGDTSTNDTALLMASGKSGVSLSDSDTRWKFFETLLKVCRNLAEQIISDGEGAQHVVRLRIEQARSRNEARQIARTIAHSLLVKTAWAGADPNWGRILAAVGRSGLAVDPSRINIFIGDQMVCRHGQSCAFDEKKAHAEMSEPKYEIRVQLGRGREFCDFLTTDLTAEYVRINADYST